METLPNVEELLRPTALRVGSITLPPDAANPLHDAEKVVMEAEVERLRRGNRALLDQLTAARKWYNKHHGIEYGEERTPPWEKVQ